MKILFLCVANSARSQMAEGLARAMFGDKIQVTSAGSVPTQVNPFAIKAMAEIGIDISHHVSKSIEVALEDHVDLVVTLCAEEVCPVVDPSIAKEHWPFEDPAGCKGSEKEILSRFADVRDQINQRLLTFHAEQLHRV